MKATGKSGNQADFSNLISKSGSTKRLLEDIASNLSAAFAPSGIDDIILDDDEWHLVVSEYEVFRLLRRAKPSKSPGVDKIPTKIYKLLAYQLAQPLTAIYNMSLKQRVFPKLWKQGIIIPVPKSNPPNLNNLRYLTLLPVPSKIMEKLVLKKMWPHFSDSYGSEQHGFRPGTSTTTALIQLHDDVTTVFDDLSHSALAILSFDMSRAFDCVDHRLIPTILRANNFPSGFINWVRSYLSDRSAYIRINGSNSSEVEIKRGVPQGSVLGPPIFCTYISKIRCLHEDVKMMKYADDITLVVPIKREDTLNMKNKIEDEIRNIEDQSHSLNLKLNLSKSQAVIITRSQQHRSTDVQLSVPTSDSLKILGLMINDRLNWDTHIKHVCKKASQRLHILRRLKQLVNKQETHDVYASVVRPLLEYACPVFVGVSKTAALKLLTLDKRAHRIIYGLDRQERQCDCNEDTLETRRIQQSKRTFYRIHNTPHHILHSRVPHKLLHSGHFSVPFCRTEKRKTSFFPFTIIYVNYEEP